MSVEMDLLQEFKAILHAMQSPTIVELGARSVTGRGLRSILDLSGALAERYVGFDIHEGPNVDTVGDAHRLSSYFSGSSVDVVMSKNVFEHIAIPWKVALEINQILKPGGIVFVNTHQSFPLHELPWDFWRFSSEAWKVLFNVVTGFEVIRTEMNFPCKIVPDHVPAGWVENHRAFVNSNLLARKVAEYDRERLSWDVDLDEILGTTYPKN